MLYCVGSSVGLMVMLVAVGAIAWDGALSWNDHDNTVSRVTRNVLERFRDRPRGVSPSDE